MWTTAAVYIGSHHLSTLRSIDGETLLRSSITDDAAGMGAKSWSDSSVDAPKPLSGILDRLSRKGLSFAVGARQAPDRPERGTV